MSVRELIVLGTASQVPTRTRNHNGYLLRFGTDGILFDPGEGTQRQMTFAGASMSQVQRVCITHAHGDHCLGLAGVVQRSSLDGLERPLTVYFPAPAAPFIERLTTASPHRPVTPVVRRACRPGLVDVLASGLRLTAAELEHSEPTLGWRLDEPDGWRLDVDRLAAAGVEGPSRAELQETGSVTVDGRRVRIEEVATERRGQSVAFVMDTRVCDGAYELAADTDLLIIEATFLETEQELAERYGHLTAGQAATIGREAGARRVVITHFSQRYPDLDGHLAEAKAAAPELDVVVARDLDVIPFPPRL